MIDPACGSGNFLTETYISLRRLENEALHFALDGQMMFDIDPIKVNISQFYGIEINDFAVTVAKTALWIAEAQMLQETEKIVERTIPFLPLKSYANITEGNALRIDWESIVPKEKLSYIMGNPPFVGYSLQSKAQKEDMLSIYVDAKGKPYKTAGKIDYVAAWYFKAAELMQNTSIRTAFVSTNSITQGEQVAGVWKPLYDRFGIHIDFAHRTFRWDSEASLKAHVHCVIVGFSVADNKADRHLFDNGADKEVKNISPYLINSENIFIEGRKKPICDVPEMILGNIPRDGGFLSDYDNETYQSIISKYPDSKPLFRKLLGSVELIHNKKRYCLWLKNVSPNKYNKISPIIEAIKGVKEFREKSPRAATQKLAEYPMLFAEIRQVNTNYLAFPEVSSQNRKYIPIAYLSPDVICTNKLFMLPNAGRYHFAVLNSNVHMAWVKTVSGRLKSDFNYSNIIVYNNFPWCAPTEEQKAKIEQTAQAILDARTLYPDSSLADLYDELTMPPELRKAHQLNDKAVMAAYGFSTKMTESECVAELMKMYQQLTAKD